MTDGYLTSLKIFQWAESPSLHFETHQTTVTE